MSIKSIIAIIIVVGQQQVNKCLLIHENIIIVSIEHCPNENSTKLERKPDSLCMNKDIYIKKVGHPKQKSSIVFSFIV